MLLCILSKHGDGLSHLRPFREFKCGSSLDEELLTFFFFWFQGVYCRKAERKSRETEGGRGHVERREEGARGLERKQERQE
jgi:hypothetical protein